MGVQIGKKVMRRRAWMHCTTAVLAAVFAAGSLLAQSSAEDLQVTVGKSIVIDYPVDVARISTSNPDIVDAVAVSTREILLHAKAIGVSTVVVWAQTGQRTFYNISVEANLEPVRRLIRETFPNENIVVQGVNGSLTLIGKASSQAVSDRAAALAASLAQTVVNNMEVGVAVDTQVVLHVRFAELNLTKAQQFGINLLSTGFLNTPAAISTQQFGNNRVGSVQNGIPGRLPGFTTDFSVSDLLNVFAFRPDLNLGATIKALQNQNVLQILAEPNLVTSMGQQASFLAGGEFPIPVLQGGSNSGAVTIQFREFGIRLTFTPQMTPNNTLKMYVKPEVSTIDLSNAVSLNGFVIPALATRRMETNIELTEGQSFAIGGLMDDRVNEQMSKIPGLSSIPVLGALFRSRQETKTKTELVVIVTPDLVDPLNPDVTQPSVDMPIDFLPQARPGEAFPQSGAVKATQGSEQAELTAEPSSETPQLIVAEIDDPAPATPLEAVRLETESTLSVETESTADQQDALSPNTEQALALESPNTVPLEVAPTSAPWDQPSVQDVVFEFAPVGVVAKPEPIEPAAAASQREAGVEGAVAPTTGEAVEVTLPLSPGPIAALRPSELLLSRHGQTGQ